MSQPGIYEKTGGATMTLVGSGTNTVVVGSAIAYVAIQSYVAQPPTPEPGLHPTLAHGHVALGAEWAVVLVVLVVGGIQVAHRIFRL